MSCYRLTKAATPSTTISRRSARRTHERLGPGRDLVRLIEGLGHELVASGEPEVRDACFDDGDTIRAAAQEVRVLIAALIDEPDEPSPEARLPGTVDGREQRARQH